MSGTASELAVNVLNPLILVEEKKMIKNYLPAFFISLEKKKKALQTPESII